MTRRRARLASQLVRLEGVLMALGEMEDSDLEAARDRSLRRLRRFFLPRLSEADLPLVVSLVGSTGSGKSTLLNSIAGEALSKVGVLRPTTTAPLIWTAPEHGARLATIGELAVGDHPLATAIALVDTPDLDSDAVDHRSMALEAAEASDAVVLVTTAARYGDADPWEALTSLPGRRTAVVLNRVPTRASGSRQDLISYLRRSFGPGVPVFTIAEQATDRIGRKLAPQAVQRLTAQLREWALDPDTVRAEAFAATADRLVADLSILHDHVQVRVSHFQALEAISNRRHREEARIVTSDAVGHSRWWKRTRRASIGSEAVLAGLDRAARGGFQEAAAAGIELGLTGQLASSKVVVEDGLSPAEVAELFDEAARAWVSGFVTWDEETVAVLAQAVTTLSEVDYPGPNFVD